MGILDTDGSSEYGIDTQMIFISVFPGANEALVCFWCCSRTMKIFLNRHLSLCPSQTKEDKGTLAKNSVLSISLISAAVFSRNMTINLTRRHCTFRGRHLKNKVIKCHIVSYICLKAIS